MFHWSDKIERINKPIPSLDYKVTGLNIESIRVNTGFSVASYYSYRSHEERTECLAVLLPGRGYTRDSPLIWYSSLSAYEAGCDTVSIEYGFQAAREDAIDQSPDTAADEVRAFLDTFTTEHNYEQLIFISKSIGTKIVARLAKHPSKSRISHIFLTPLKQTVEFIRNSDRILVLVGENDPFFDGNDIRLISSNRNAEIVTFPNANHSLEVQGDYTASIQILEKVADSVYDFCKS